MGRKKFVKAMPSEIFNALHDFDMKKISAYDFAKAFGCFFKVLTMAELGSVRQFNMAVSSVDECLDNAYIHHNIRRESENKEPLVMPKYWIDEDNRTADLLLSLALMREETDNARRRGETL